MIKLAICDDDYNVIEIIKTYIDKSTEFSIEYEAFSSAEELEKYNLNNQEYFDIYLLDIEMKQMSGLEIAKKIRKDNPYALIVFLTSHAQYVYDVFEVVTFDFVMKPLTYKKFNEIIVKVENYLGIAKTKFVFTYKKNNYSIPFQKINYIEKIGRKVIIYTVDEKTYQCNMNLKGVWKQLNTHMFVPLHQSCIVNLEEVVKIEGEEVLLKNNKKLYVARNYRRSVKKSHLNFLKERL